MPERKKTFQEGRKKLRMITPKEKNEGRKLWMIRINYREEEEK